MNRDETAEAVTVLSFLHTPHLNTVKHDRYGRTPVCVCVFV